MRKSGLQTAKENHFVTQALGKNDTYEVTEYYKWCRQENIPQVTIIHGKINKSWKSCEIRLRNGGCFDFEASLQIFELIRHAIIEWSKVSKYVYDEWQWNVLDERAYVEGSPITGIEDIAQSMYNIALGHAIPYKEYQACSHKIQDAIQAKREIYSSEEYRERIISEINKARLLSGLKPITVQDEHKKQKLLMERWDKVESRKRYIHTFSEGEILDIADSIGTNDYYSTLDILASRDLGKNFTRQDIEDRLTGKC